MPKGIYKRSDSFRKSQSIRMTGKKGPLAIHFGKKHSEKSIQKMSKSHKGAIVTKKTRKKISLGLTGFKRPPRTKEHIRKHSLALLGKKHPNRKLPPPFTKDHKINISKGGYGHITTEETKQKIRETKIGEKNPMFGKFGKDNPCWIEDRTKLQKSEKDRRSSASNYWRKETKLRDNKKCKLFSNDCMGQIESHHILNWEDYPELRYDINNGITLCHYHHPRGRKKEKQMIKIFKKLIK